MEYIPTERKEGHLTKIPKKGDLSKCANYRGVTLLSIPSKIFYRIILDRMIDAVDLQLRDQQAGFRKDRSCIDQIATLHTTAHHCPVTAVTGVELTSVSELY